MFGSSLFAFFAMKEGAVKFNMSFLAFFLFVFLAFQPTALAYPQDQLKDCISSAQKNPNLEEVSLNSIENYCDCALNLIVNEKKDVRESGYECAVKSFG